MIAAPQLREPSRSAWIIAVQQLSRPVEPIRATAEPRLPSPDNKPRVVYRGKHPALRSKESKTVWRVLKRTDEWLTRVEILDAAKLFDWQKDGYGDRNAGNSALVNLVKGRWVDVENGKFRRATATAPATLSAAQSAAAPTPAHPRSSPDAPAPDCPTGRG